MEWSDLHVFLAVARAGTLGAAARRLNQSQPTMGRRVKALEEAVGQKLFQRTSDGFVLTEEGAAVLSHAEQIEQEAQAFERRLRGHDQALDGSLRMSCSDWFGLHLLAPVIAEFAVLQPRVTVELLTDARLYSLARREADLVFRIAPFDEADVIARRLIHIRYAAYLHKGARAAARGRRRRHRSHHDGHCLWRHARCGLADTDAAERPDCDQKQ